MAKLVQRIRKTVRPRQCHLDILNVLNAARLAPAISLVYFRSMISDRHSSFHRRMDPALYETYAGILRRHYALPD